ncbi:ribosomal-protein-alanine acetyltransferase [gut metagenome]|uniref:Ribosomal-protein-alanine acetyltransferase n=1 Tax=gut metagenome TaxID=749906 RepID=J9GDQ9_9ZZZZ
MSPRALFRGLSPEDAPLLAALEAEVEPTPWHEQDFTDVLKQQWWGSVLTDEKGGIVAWAVVMPVVDECELLTIGVRPASQGKGYGRLMLQEAIRCAREAGARCCHLEVRESNSRAINLYESSGFTRVGLRKAYYRTPAGRENAILMRADLTPEAHHAER